MTGIEVEQHGAEFGLAGASGFSQASSTCRRSDQMLEVPRMLVALWARQEQLVLADHA